MIGNAQTALPAPIASQFFPPKYKKLWNTEKYLGGLGGFVNWNSWYDRLFQIFWYFSHHHSSVRECCCTES
jgi:hypothetical protein